MGSKSTAKYTVSVVKYKYPVSAAKYMVMQPSTVQWHNQVHRKCSQVHGNAATYSSDVAMYKASGA